MITQHMTFHKLNEKYPIELYGDFEINNITDTYVNFSVRTLINSLTKEELKMLVQRLNNELEMRD